MTGCQYLVLKCHSRKSIDHEFDSLIHLCYSLKNHHEEEVTELKEVRYRPKIGRLLEEIGQSVPGFRLDPQAFADYVGVSKGTIYNWIGADTDNPIDWFEKYDPRVERKFRQSLSKMLGRKVEVIGVEEVEASRLNSSIENNEKDDNNQNIKQRPPADEPEAIVVTADW
jgi:hypothetical protein